MIDGWELDKNVVEPELVAIDKGANKSSVIITCSIEWSWLIQSILWTSLVIHPNSQVHSLEIVRYFVGYLAENISQSA